MVLARMGLQVEYILVNYCQIACQCDAKGVFCIMPLCMGYANPKQVFKMIFL